MDELEMRENISAERRRLAEARDHLLASVLLAPFIAVERLLTGVRSQWSWALPAAFHGWRLLRRGDVELVYSTGGVFAAHLAGYWLKRLTGCRWIAEVHDATIEVASAPDRGTVVSVALPTSPPTGAGVKRPVVSGETAEAAARHGESPSVRTAAP